MVELHELTLCVVNDGAGNKDRLATARRTDSLDMIAEAWLRHANDGAWINRRAFGTHYSVAERLRVAMELAAYYANHVQEIDAVTDEGN